MKRLRLLYQDRSISLKVYLDTHTFSGDEVTLVVMKYGQPTQILRDDAAFETLRQIKDNVPLDWKGWG